MNSAFNHRFTIGQINICSHCDANANVFRSPSSASSPFALCSAAVASVSSKQCSLAIGGRGESSAQLKLHLDRHSRLRPPRHVKQLMRCVRQLTTSSFGQRSRPGARSSRSGGIVWIDRNERRRKESRTTRNEFIFGDPLFGTSPLWSTWPHYFMLFARIFLYSSDEGALFVAEERRDASLG